MVMKTPKWCSTNRTRFCRSPWRQNVGVEEKRPPLARSSFIGYESFPTFKIFRSLRFVLFFRFFFFVCRAAAWRCNTARIFLSFLCILCWSEVRRLYERKKRRAPLSGEGEVGEGYSHAFHLCLPSWGGRGGQIEDGSPLPHLHRPFESNASRTDKLDILSFCPIFSAD